MSGGYYKFHCKNFYTHNCNNWVWANNIVCDQCLSVGREAADHDEGDMIHEFAAESRLVTAEMCFYPLGTGVKRKPIDFEEVPGASTNGATRPRNYGLL